MTKEQFRPSMSTVGEIPAHSEMSIVLRTSYGALLVSLIAEPSSDIRGAVDLKARGPSRYWYDSYRSGNRVKTRYLGPDNEETRRKVEIYQNSRHAYQIRLAARKKLVGVLRAASHISLSSAVGRLLAQFAADGGFQHGAVLIGGLASDLYAVQFGVTCFPPARCDWPASPFPNIALAALEPVSEHVRSAASCLLASSTKSNDPHYPSAWQQGRAEVHFATMTPRSYADEALPWDEARYGVSPLTFLLSQSVEAALPFRGGVLIRIPAPERFAIHKLITAQIHEVEGRMNRSRHDLQSAAALLVNMAHHDATKLADAWYEASAVWKAQIETSLAQLPDAARCALSRSLT